MTDLLGLPFAVYDKATGRIRRSGTVTGPAVGPTDLGAQVHANDEAVLPGAWPWQTCFVDLTGAVPAGRLRPTLPGFDKLAIKADAADKATIQLPAAATVEVDGTAYAAQAGAWSLSVDMPGRYVVAISLFPYLDFTATITATR